MTNLDQNIPQASSIRSRILSFMPAEKIMEASRINENWFNAAAEFDAWRPRFEEKPLLQDTVNEPYIFPSAMMYDLTVKAIDEVKDHLANSLDAEEFYKHIGQIIGQASPRYHVLFPIAHYYIRSSRIRDMPVDEPVREGYVAQPRGFLILANVLRWHFVDPRAADIPWMISFLDWATHSFTPFHKMMLVAPVYTMTSESAQELLTDDDLNHLIDATRTLIDKRIGENRDQSSLREEANPLPETDPRLAFSIYYYIQKHFADRGFRAAIDEHVDSNFGDWGKKEVEAAGKRVEMQLKAQAEAKVKKEQEIKDRIAKYRKEHNIPDPKDTAASS